MVIGHPPLPVIAWQTVMYTLSTSGLSSLSTFIATKFLFIISATSSSSKDSFSITWHQWHVEYPTLKNIGLSSSFAFLKASSFQLYQFIGLYACCKRYGDFSFIRLLGFLLLSKIPPHLLFYYMFCNKQIDIHL